MTMPPVASRLQDDLRLLHRLAEAVVVVFRWSSQPGSKVPSRCKQERMM